MMNKQELMKNFERMIDESSQGGLDVTGVVIYGIVDLKQHLKSRKGIPTIVCGIGCSPSKFVDAAAAILNLAVEHCPGGFDAIMESFCHKMASHECVTVVEERMNESTTIN